MTFDWGRFFRFWDFKGGNLSGTNTRTSEDDLYRNGNSTVGW